MGRGFHGAGELSIGRYHVFPEHYSPQNDFPRVSGPSKTLIIASTPRSGSYMLAHILHVCGQFGFPLEYALRVDEWMRRLGTTTFSETLQEILRIRTSPNGVFSIKLHYPHVKRFGSFTGVHREFPDPHYLLLTRDDAVAQAVSWSKAIQTGVWISGQKPISKDCRYDYEDIRWRLRRTFVETASWRYQLAVHGCKYVEMSFEQVVKDVSGTVSMIGDFLGVELPKGCIPARPTTTKQSDDLNRIWKETFLSQVTGDLFDLPMSTVIPRKPNRLRNLLHNYVSRLGR